MEHAAQCHQEKHEKYFLLRHLLLLIGGKHVELHHQREQAKPCASAELRARIRTRQLQRQECGAEDKRDFTNECVGLVEQHREGDNGKHTSRVQAVGSQRVPKQAVDVVEKHTVATRNRSIESPRRECEIRHHHIHKSHDYHQATGIEKFVYPFLSVCHVLSVGVD